MFICRSCASEARVQSFIETSYGRCEVCDKTASCADIHHSRFPDPPKNPEEEKRFEKTQALLRGAHQEEEKSRLGLPGVTSDNETDTSNDLYYRVKIGLRPPKQAGVWIRCLQWFDELGSDDEENCGDIKFKSEDEAREWILEYYNDVVDVMRMTDALGIAIANTYFKRKFRNHEES